MRLACNLGLVGLLALLVLPCGCGQQAATPLQGFVPAMAGDLALKVPAAWQRVETKSPMRKGEWRLPGKDKPDATLTVYTFGGEAGSLEQNLARWTAQFEQQPPGNAKSAPLRFPGRPAMHSLEVRGTYVAETAPGSGQSAHEPDWKMTAVVVSLRQGTYYLKLVGPEATVDRWAEDFHVVLGQIGG